MSDHITRDRLRRLALLDQAQEGLTAEQRQNLPQWTDDEALAFLAEAARDLMLDETVRRQLAVGGRFAVVDGDGGYCVLDREHDGRDGSGHIVGPVSREAADRVRDDLVQSALEALAEADDEHLLRLHMQAWHVRRAETVQPLTSADLQADHRADHEFAGRVSLLPFPEHGVDARGVEAPPGLATEAEAVQ